MKIFVKFVNLQKILKIYIFLKLFLNELNIYVRTVRNGKTVSEWWVAHILYYCIMSIVTNASNLIIQ